MSTERRFSPARCAAFLLVLMLHGALIAALWDLLAASAAPGAATAPLQYVYLAPTATPKVKAQTDPIRLLRADALILPELRASDPVTAQERRSALLADGDGNGVDWAAEARRALHADEIRSHLPSGALSNAPLIDGWRRSLAHHPEEQYKTADGDWIVWVTADCYEIASAAGRLASSTAPGRIICPRKPNARTSSTR